MCGIIGSGNFFPSLYPIYCEELPLHLPQCHFLLLHIQSHFVVRRVRHPHYRLQSHIFGLEPGQLQMLITRSTQSRFTRVNPLTFAERNSCLI